MDPIIWIQIHGRSLSPPLHDRFRFPASKFQAAPLRRGWGEFWAAPRGLSRSEQKPCGLGDFKMTQGSAMQVGSACSGVDQRTSTHAFRKFKWWLLSQRPPSHWCQASWRTRHTWWESGRAAQLLDMMSPPLCNPKMLASWVGRSGPKRTTTIHSHNPLQQPTGQPFHLSWALVTAQMTNKRWNSRLLCGNSFVHDPFDVGPVQKTQIPTLQSTLSKCFHTLQKNTTAHHKESWKKTRWHWWLVTFAIPLMTPSCWVKAFDGASRTSIICKTWAVGPRKLLSTKGCLWYLLLPLTGKKLKMKRFADISCSKLAPQQKAGDYRWLIMKDAHACCGAITRRRLPSWFHFVQETPPACTFSSRVPSGSSSSSCCFTLSYSASVKDA